MEEFYGQRFLPLGAKTLEELKQHILNSFRLEGPKVWVKREIEWEEGYGLWCMEEVEALSDVYNGEIVVRTTCSNPSIANLTNTFFEENEYRWFAQGHQHDDEVQA
jgi:hypothetical protein